MLYEYPNPLNVQTDVLVGIWDLGLLDHLLAPPWGLGEAGPGTGLPDSTALCTPDSLSGSICFLRAFNVPLSLASA